MFKSRGIFITLEGVDGCGKSTQAAMLFEWFKQQKLDFIQVREPGGTVTGEAVRQILLDNRSALGLQTELLLYMAARAELTEQVIIPALKSGKVVLADRFTDSTMAYQGYGGGTSLQWIRTLNKNVTRGIKPDITILLDLPVEEAARRRGKTADRMESRDLNYHRRVRRGYLELAAAEPQRIKVVNAAADQNEIHAMICCLLEEFALKAGGF